VSSAARAVLRVAAAVVLLWLVLVAFIWMFQRQLIYLPDRSTPPLPAGVEEVSFRTADGLELSAWFVPARDPELPVSTVLVTNGNAGHRGHRLPLAQGLAARGHAVLLMDYRGYGGNPGRPSERGLILDARGAHAYLAGRDDVAADRIVHFGESIGSGVAAGVALDDPPTALVLRSPFPSLVHVGRHHYPFLPVGLLLRDRFPTSERLERYDGPVLVIAGGRDSIVPTALSREVAERAGAQYFEIAGVNHNDLALLAGDEFLDAIDTFIRDNLAALDR
jgi:uncharacterized protein